VRQPIWKNHPSPITKLLLSPVPYSWGGAVFQIVGVSLAIWWFRVTPPSGFAVAALAIAATIMAVRALRFTTIEGVVWILIAFSLFIVEIRAIQKDREDFARDDAVRRAEENTKFQGIVDRLTASIDLSNKTLATSNATVRQLTGGGEFCYLTAALPAGTSNGKSVWQLAVQTSGTIPMDVCHVHITENIPVMSPADIQRPRMTFDQALGPVAPGKISGQAGTNGKMTPIICRAHL
jgi:hypothetical protein